MKECVSEHIQMLCMEDTAFARLTMHPKKNMIRCFQYINRKAWDYVQDELKASGTRPGPGQQTYGCDVPDDCAISGRKIISVTLMPRKTMRMRKNLFPSRMLGSPLQRANQEGGREEKDGTQGGTKQEEKKPFRMGRCRCWILGWQRQAERQRRKNAE